MGLFSEYESAKGIGDLLDGVKKEFDLDEIVAKERIKENVDNLFGHGLGDKMKILKLEAGVLTLICESSAWREELKLRQDNIVTGINNYFSEKNNKKIVQRIDIK